MDVDLDALRIVIRETLDTFIRDHEGVEAADIEIAAPPEHCINAACDIIVNGCRFTVRVA